MATGKFGEVDSIPKSAGQMSRNATHRARLEFRRGGAGVPLDDGRGWCERTGRRSPRSDTGFETAHGEATGIAPIGLHFGRSLSPELPQE